MNVTYIIPIKKHLASYYLTKNGPITNHKVDAIKYAFDFFAGYYIKRKELIESYMEWKVYKRAKPNQYPKSLVKIFHPDKYTYLKMDLPVRSQQKEIDLSIKQDMIVSIRCINSGLATFFWMHCVSTIESTKDKTIDQKISEYYKEHELNESELKKSSFKTILYRKRKQDINYQSHKKYVKRFDEWNILSMSRKERKQFFIELESKKI